LICALSPVVCQSREKGITMGNNTHAAVADFCPPTLSAVCAYCKRVRTAAGHWRAPDSLCPNDTDHLTHSACPACYGIAVIALLEEIREEMGAKIDHKHDGY
jgi:hypothetical protein